MRSLFAMAAFLFSFNTQAGEAYRVEPFEKTKVIHHWYEAQGFNVEHVGIGYTHSVEQVVQRPCSSDDSQVLCNFTERLDRIEALRVLVTYDIGGFTHPEQPTKESLIFYVPLDQVAPEVLAKARKNSWKAAKYFGVDVNDQYFEREVVDSVKSEFCIDWESREIAGCEKRFVYKTMKGFNKVVSVRPK